jgi:signal transduction histidine kinase
MKSQLRGPLAVRSPLLARLPAALTVPRGPVVLDAGLALVLAALSLVASWRLIFPDQGVDGKIGYPVYGSPQALHWFAVGWLVAVTVELTVLPLRRRLPVPVLLITLAMAVVHSQLLPLTPAPADVAVAVAVYTVAAALPRLTSAALVAACVGTGMAIDTLVPRDSSGPKVGMFWPVKPTLLIVPVLVLAAAWVAGDSARTRRAYLAEVERRARDAERDRDQRAELAASAERERIARELHDVIAHALSVMVVQAQGAGSALRRRRTAQADEALDAIVATGRGALAETRRVLGAIRLSGSSGGLELAPQPCLDDLPLLADSVRQAGTPVELRVTGRVRPLPPGIELSAYRIAQEALTNTMRHAGPGAAASVCVDFSDSDLLLDISDNGHPERTRGSPEADPDSDRAGHGLAGMRARVAMLGGTMAAGRDPAGGFRVRVRLPVPGGPAPEPAVPQPAVPQPVVTEPAVTRPAVAQRGGS